MLGGGAVGRQAGKSTLLKLMFGELSPTEGEVRKHTHLRIAKYHQHSTDQVPPPRHPPPTPTADRHPSPSDARTRTS